MKPTKKFMSISATRLVLAGWLFVAYGAAAQGSLDQSVLNTSGSSGVGQVLSSSNQLAQTFTVGIAGQLTGVDLQVFQAGTTNQLTENLVLVVYVPATSTNPIGTILATANVYPADVPNLPQMLAGALVFVDLSAFSISVNQGDVLSLALTTAQPVPTPAYVHYTWVTPGGLNGPYSAGQAWRALLPNGFDALGNRDFGFQTYVDAGAIITVTPVPEPSVAAFAAMGFFVWIYFNRWFHRAGETSKK